MGIAPTTLEQAFRPTMFCFNVLGQFGPIQDWYEAVETHNRLVVVHRLLMFPLYLRVLECLLAKPTHKR